ncbi:MAG: hypothetical protein Q4F74_03010 [Synergistaceae bacterium]|nr:hypothetical protein [Synergistaceae bacterium]
MPDSGERWITTSNGKHVLINKKRLGKLPRLKPGVSETLVNDR